ncbi:MAG: GNAT family N-acetyltransferase [Clostridiaceae bacterium]|jgi:predicted GNAT family acetyltransferase|nr:GNAT family N-acetyltransferase [Clostridiaceae bacterium]
MIKRAENENFEAIVNYLDKGGSINTTLLSYIEKYGFEKDFQDFWLYNDGSDSILAVLMRHFNSLYVYCEDSFFDAEELGSFISFIGPEIISGKRDIINSISLFTDDMFLEPSTHMVLENTDKLKTCTMVEKARLDDCRELAGLIFSIPDFAKFYHSSKEIESGIRRRMEMGICRYFVLRKNGKIVTQAYTTIESKKYATLGGIVTRNGYRRQGLASLVVSCICEDILKDNKIPNLFYSNADAGRVYENLGFVPVYDYAMLLNYKYKATQIL